MAKLDNTTYEFGPFRLESGERRLLRNHQPETLTAKLFDILLLLVRNSGEVVTKAVLMREIWSDRFVEENNLTVSISTLRKILGDQYREREYIETVPKRGYRFIARVKEVHDEGDSGYELPAGSLAVLPFLNVGGSSDLEYLSDGITESIICSMSRLPRLRVMARSTVFQYKGRGLDARQIGRELNVQTVLMGRLQEFNGQLLLGVEIVNVSDGSQIWGETYNRPLSDIFGIQEEIAGELSEKLRLELTSEDRKRLTERHTQNFEVYYLYLKGRYFWNKRTLKDMERAVKYFEQSLAREPNYALAHIGLAGCYLGLIYLNARPASECIPIIKREATEALALDETIAEAHACLGYIEILALNWSEAERELRRAIELDPNNAMAHNRYSIYLILRGHEEEAIAEAEQALVNDSLSPHMHVNVARIFYYARQYERAMEECHQALEIEPDFGAAHGVLGLIYQRREMFEEAISEIQWAINLLGKDPEAMGLLGHFYAVSGKRREARRVLNKMLKLSEQKYVSSLFIAWIYAGLREEDAAFVWLERAYEERSYIPLLAISPLLDSLRPDPRYADLLRRCGLPSQHPPTA